MRRETQNRLTHPSLHHTDPPCRCCFTPQLIYSWCERENLFAASALYWASTQASLCYHTATICVLKAIFDSGNLQLCTNRLTQLLQLGSIVKDLQNTQQNTLKRKCRRWVTGVPLERNPVYEVAWRFIMIGWKQPQIDKVLAVVDCIRYQTGSKYWIFLLEYFGLQGRFVRAVGTLPILALFNT